MLMDDRDHWLHQLENATRNNNTRQMAKCHKKLGQFYASIDLNESSCEHFQQAADLYGKCDRELQKGHCVFWLADQMKECGNWEESIAVFEQALEIYKSEENQFYITHTLTHLSNAYLAEQKYNQALEIALRSVELSREQNEVAQISHALGVLANVYKAQEDNEKELETLQESVTISENGESSEGLAYALGAMEAYYFRSQDSDLAQNYLQRSYDVLQQTPELAKKSDLYFKISDRYSDQYLFSQAQEVLLSALQNVDFNKASEHETPVYYCLAQLAYHMADLKQSNYYCLILLEQYKRLELHGHVATVLNWLGRNYRFLKNFSEAEKCFSQLLEYSTTAEGKSWWSTALISLATIEVETDRLESAEIKCLELLEIAERDQDVAAQSTYKALLSDIYGKRKEFDKADRTGQEALALARESENKTRELIVLSRMGNVFFDKGDYQQAKECWLEALVIAQNNLDQNMSNFLQNKIDKLPTEKV